MKLLQREPVLMTTIAALLAAELAKYGFDIQPSVLTSLFEAGLALAAALLARSRVTPV